MKVRLLLEAQEISDSKVMFPVVPEPAGMVQVTFVQEPEPDVVKVTLPLISAVDISLALTAAFRSEGSSSIIKSVGSSNHIPPLPTFIAASICRVRPEVSINPPDDFCEFRPIALKEVEEFRAVKALKGNDPFTESLPISIFPPFCSPFALSDALSKVVLTTPDTAIVPPRPDPPFVCIRPCTSTAPLEETTLILPPFNDELASIAAVFVISMYSLPSISMVLRPPFCDLDLIEPATLTLTPKRLIRGMFGVPLFPVLPLLVPNNIPNISMPVAVAVICVALTEDLAPTTNWPGVVNESERLLFDKLLTLPNISVTLSE